MEKRVTSLRRIGKKKLSLHQRKTTKKKSSLAIYCKILRDKTNNDSNGHFECKRYAKHIGSINSYIDLKHVSNSKVLASREDLIFQ